MTLKFKYLILILIGCSNLLLAQNPSKVTIRSLIRDTSDAEVPFATVMLLTPKDSTLVNFTTSDGKGAFSFNNVRNVPYLLKISHISYLPHQELIAASANAINDLGIIRVKPLSNVLMEVVVKAAKAPLRIRGDTVEYDATTFKVPPGSTVEDLLRRLPGIEVDAEGNIRTQGKDVKRVFVDGKTFFGDDPKSVTKNLGAEAISKVQVFDEKSEQSKLTGIDDGTKEKAMNLELKEDFKKGAFGKITVAGGTDERWASRGNYNRFNDKNQFSLIGYANNINQTGVNWEDYGEFKGQNAFNEYDNGDFGFSSGGGRYYFSSDDSPMNRFDGRGFTKNFGAGTNYNYDHKKTKFNASYFYNQTKLNLDQYSDKQTFLNDSSIFNKDTLNQSDFRGSHSFATRFEKELDSNNIIIAKANFRVSTSSTNDNQRQHFYYSEDNTINTLKMVNGTKLDSWKLTSAAIYRHRFKKKGRSFAISTGYNISRSDGSDSLFSLNEFFKATTVKEQIRKLNARDNDATQFKSSMLYTEPLSKVWYWESFYNFSTSSNSINRQVRDSNNVNIPNLSVYYTNDVLYNRVGSSIRYSNKGLNIAVGAAVQQLQLKGNYANFKDMPFADSLKLTRKFNNWAPNVSASYQLPHNMWLSTNYNYEINEPDIDDLQSVPNSDNPLYVSKGNPNLKPERSHSIGLNFNYWNPSSFANVGIGSNYNKYDENIVYNQDVIDSLGVRTTTTPVNIKGGSNLSIYLWSSFPIIKTKLTIDMNGSMDFGNSPAYVNNISNETRNKGYNFDFGISLTPSPKVIIYMSEGINFNDITYSIREEQNQKIRNYETSASVKWQFASKFFLESNFNYSIYRNDKFDFNRDMPIWNGSVRRILGKKNRLEVRMAVFDILNKRVYISQNGSANYISHVSAPTLARYYMLSVTYNLRGFEDKLKKNNFW
jgi:hypothetical protein